jgi:MoaA/NifB/PqqE/SkfB family radical SAM enzyme
MAGGKQTLSPPKELYLETTNRCNLSCRSCIQHLGGWEPGRDLSLQEFTMVTDQFPNLERAVLHGIGEPLLNSELPAMVRHLKKRKVTVLFNSNGTLLEEARQRELIESGLDELRISLDSASPGTYRAVRSSDRFDLVVDNLRSFARRVISESPPRPKLSLWFLGNRENLAELPGLVRLAASIGVPEVHLQRLVYFLDREGHGLAEERQSLAGPDAETLELIRRSQSLAAELGIELSASGLGTPERSVQGNGGEPSPWKRCRRPWVSTYITAHGTVLPCCISPFATSEYQSLSLGNVFEDDFAAIWSGPGYRAFRERHPTGSPPSCCRGCGVRWSL